MRGHTCHEVELEVYTTAFACRLPARHCGSMLASPRVRNVRHYSLGKILPGGVFRVNIVEEKNVTQALQAVLWDMDGTLVDTEPYWYNAEVELLDEYGKPWSVQQSEALIGNALPLSAVVLQQAGVDLGIRDIIDRLTYSVACQVRQRVPWRPGARELLAQLHAAAVPCALVTMSETALADEVIHHLPEDTFCVQVTGTSVERGKPAPDPYLLAVQRLIDQTSHLTVTNSDSMLAIEDSLTGVTSALAAGLTTVGVPNILPLAPQPGLTVWPTLAGKTVDDLVEELKSSRPSTTRIVGTALGA